MICFKAADLDTGASSDTSIINEMTCGEKTKLFFGQQLHLSFYLKA